MQTTQWFTSVQIAVKISNTTWMPTLLPNGWTTTIRPYTPKSKFVLFRGDSRLKTCQGIKLVNDHEKKFPAFARSWGFEKVTSSPKLPKVSREYPALLDWRRTTTETVLTKVSGKITWRRCTCTGSLGSRSFGKVKFGIRLYRRNWRDIQRPTNHSFRKYWMQLRESLQLLRTAR